MSILLGGPFAPEYRHEVFILKKLPYDLWAAEGPVNRVVLKVDKYKRIEIDHRPISLEHLPSRIKARMAQVPEEWRIVTIKASKELNYGDVVSIIDIAKGAGARAAELQIDYLENLP
jgi:biopolymer transport protein ExbD